MININNVASGTPQRLDIDFLYLDLNTCERCMATDGSLREALAVMSPMLDALNYEAVVNSVNITSKELAATYHFVSSPTIRVNGHDIFGEVSENNCTDCGDICGDDVDCRTFLWEGETYTQPPVSMVIDGILRTLYASERPVHAQASTPEYTLPENLEKFFSGSSCGCGDGCCS